MRSPNTKTQAQRSSREKSPVNAIPSIYRLPFVYTSTTIFGLVKGSQKAGRGQTQRHLDSASLMARAEECRALAGESNDEKMRAVMFRIAADYEQMAVNAARLERETESD